MAEESVKVAVRVRPFNSREKARSAQLIIDMQGTTTTIKNPADPNGEPRKFNFDHSYWSHDGFEEDANGYLTPVSPRYADQKRVFSDLGNGVLKNAWEGYNCSLFAYGQTGSGKSYSVVGYGANKGIVPMFCNQVFVGIDEKKAEGTKTEYEVNFSMLEIYNEQVRDLLSPSNKKKGGLRVREHPKKGFYAEGLRTVPVNSYNDIENRMEEGTRNRTVAATQMNATSSRAHTIVGVSFTQKSFNDAGQEMAKVSLINLVDLAGSERADSTGATGDRLKEGAAINQSLSALGNVIAALADASQGKRVKVPYRDSVLTRLLKNALGGNSKTIMIAALSPADINYEETLSTLRYADRAKQIKTKAVVNEDPTEKLIRELKEENEKLREALKNGGVISMKADDDDDEAGGKGDVEAIRKQLEEEMKAVLEANELEMEMMKKTWQEKLDSAGKGDEGEKSKKEECKTTPHLYNLNIDNQLSGMIVHIIKEGTLKVGSTKASPQADIVLSGLGIQPDHALLAVENGNVFLEKVADGKVLLNGEPLTSKQQLDHNDRIMFGSNHMYVFQHPGLKAANPDNYRIPVTYEMAQQEIAQNNGFDMSSKQSVEEMILQEDLIDLMPAVEEANAISEDLDRKVKFEIVVVSPKARGLTHGRTEVCVKMRNMVSDQEYIWSRDKFQRRKYLMQEMYENYSDGEDWQLPDEKDPFTESPDTEIQIGHVNIYLQSMAYMIELKDSLEVYDMKGKEIGMMDVEVIPCNAKGKELTEADDMFVDDPKELISSSVNFVVKIQSIIGLPNKYTDLYCRYNMFLDVEPTKTKVIQNTSNPEFKHRKNFSFNPATSQLVDYLANGILAVQVWGKYKTEQAHRTKNMSTKQMVMSETLAKGRNLNVNGVKACDPEKVALKFQMTAFKKQQERLSTKVAQIRRCVQVAEEHKKARIQTLLLKEVLNAQNPKTVEMAIKRIPQDDGCGPYQPESQQSAMCKLM
ncbi:kinesin-like protein KIF28P [Anneissia japonica]|uniref:kinesin-like protein KIF28P n=1 Tax=Anneissia japonica TaxID=1529436 RepID=UPI001425657B|nr:kinesin-like protein KIF28P [Anneissia japonica]